MKKLVILSLIAPAVLGLSACGGSTNTTAPVVNADDANLTAMDDGNMADNATVSDNAAAPVNAM